MSKPIGELLIELGVLDQAGLERGLRAQQDHGEPLGLILSKLGLISDADWARALSVQLDLPLIGPDDYPPSALAIGQDSSNFLRQSRIIPLKETPEGLRLAMADPLDRYTIDAMELVASMSVLPCVGTERDIEAAWERLYHNGRSAIDLVADAAGDLSREAGIDDVERLKNMASEAPVIRLVNTLISRAMEARASDIHIEPFEKRLVVRYRIDGILREVDPPPVHLAAAVVSRVKIMANLDIAERRLAQDGRIRIGMLGREVDMRVSTVPSLYGESVVMRLLEHTAVELSFPALGFTKAVEETLLATLAQRHGIMLVTGPTGSGKTTTLYTAINHLNTRERKIITVEDPVEYQLDGITQIPVNPEIDFTFATVLRSIVRQDPDIIMIGEMRDVETAEIAVQSALTGHLVLSTLHTNDAPGAITRMLDMGVEDYLLTSTVNAVLAQRLVRTLCSGCREPYEAPAELVERMNLRSFTGGEPVTLYRAVGCERCGGRGYAGRIGIYELLVMTEPLRRLVLKRADAGTLREAAIGAGMITMLDDGLLKAVDGATTIEEIRRVTLEH